MDEQTHKHSKSEKDDKEGLEKGKGGRAGKKEKNKQKRGKVARYVPIILLLSLLTYSTPMKTSADKAKEEAAAKAAAKHLQWVLAPPIEPLPTHFHRKTKQELTQSGLSCAPPGHPCRSASPQPATTSVHSRHQQQSDLQVSGDSNGSTDSENSLTDRMGTHSQTDTTQSKTGCDDGHGNNSSDNSDSDAGGAMSTDSGKSRSSDSPTVRATAVGRDAERNAERNAVLAGDPKWIRLFM